MSGSNGVRSPLLFLEAPGSRCSENLRRDLEDRFEVRRHEFAQNFDLSGEQRILVDLSGLDEDGVDGALESLGNGDQAAWIALLAERCEPRGPGIVERGAHSYFLAESARGDDLAAALRSAEIWKKRFVMEREKARAMKSLIGQIPGILWTTDRGDRITSRGGAGLQEIGRGQGGGLPGQGPELDHDEFFGTDASREAWAEAHHRALEGEVVEFEQEAADKVHTGWIRPLTDLDGSVIGTVGLCVDITEKRRLTDELRRSHARQENLLDNLLDPLGIYEAVRDEDGIIQDFLVEYVNQAATQANRIPRDRQVGQLLTELLPAHARTGLLDVYRDVAETGKVVQLESFSFSDPEGAEPVTGTFDIRAFKLEDGFAATWREVGEAARQTEEFRRTEERLATVLKEAPLVLFTLDRGGIITLSVGGALSRIDLKAGEMVGRSVFDLFPDDPEQQKLIHAALTGERFAAITPLRGATFAVQYQPLRDADGEVIGTIGVATDITERRRLEDQLHQAQKMEAVGQLASGVAHDFNNLLTAIRGNAQLLSLEELPTEWSAHVDEIVATADRATLLTRQLLTFSRQEPRSPEILELNEVVEGALQLIRRVIGADIKVVSRPHVGRLFVHMDRNRAEQILLNLAVNARDAMSRGGELSIETGLVELASRVQASHDVIPPGRWAQIVVRDTGTGMPPEVQQRIFEPFYTTKERGRGTGLGLSTVWGIVREAGGHVHVYSEAGEGTLFRIYVPLQADPAVPVGTKTPRASKLRPTTQPSTILLVEDEAAVRKVACRVLTRAGHTVLEASDGAEALELLKEKADAVDLVLTDVVMPKVTGPELVEQLRERWPSVQVLFMSGYSGEDLRGKRQAVRGARFLQKPFDLTALIAAVEEILSEDEGEDEG